MSSPNTQTENQQRDPLAVDMVGLARDMTLRDDVRELKDMIKIIAPAKVNLYLGIGARRDDGYHDATNIMQSLMLHDVVYMKRVPAEGPEVEAASEANEASKSPQINVRCVSCEGVSAPDISSEQNIAHIAIARLAEATGVGAGDSIEVRIDKHIPHQAGLGGGSSDAAAALIGAAKLWELDPEDPAIEEVARGLGADVAFFLHGGCGRFGGVGEIFEASLGSRKDAMVLVRPDAGLSTGAVYRKFDELTPSIPEDIAVAAQAAENAVDVSIFNNLAVAAEALMPELTRVREWLEAQEGVTDVLLCGSGSTTFALCTDMAAALRISAAAKQQGWWARTTNCSPIGAAIVPNK